MATRLRVAVVGDGIIGWSTASELARRGLDVTHLPRILVDRPRDGKMGTLNFSLSC